MLIKDKIYIDLDAEPQPVLAEMLDKLKYPNPDYYQKMNMGLSVWGLPKTIETYRQNGRKIEVLRGEYYKIAPYIHSRLKTSHPTLEPTGIQYINNDFDLDEFQENAVKAILSKKQGIIHAVTSAGKSLIIIKSICERNLPALIIVHRKLLMKQILEDIEKYVRDKNGNTITPGIIGNGKLSFGPITIAIDKSASKNISLIREKFGVLFLDECHIVPSTTIRDTVNAINSEYRFGVSGTLRRKDQKEFLIFSTFGRVIYTITKEQLLDLKRIVPVELKIIESETQFDYDGAIELLGMTGAYQLMEKTVSLDPGRNEMILELLKDLPGKTMVLSKLVKPCYYLQKRLKERFSLESGVITGKNTKEAEESYSAMKFEGLRIIFATIGCVSTGISISDLDNIILISPLYTNELLLHQIRGRLMRKAKGKEKGTMYYVYDKNIFPVYKLNKFIKIMEL